MSSQFAIAALQSHAIPSRIAGVGGHSRAALTSLLLGDHAQVASGTHAGAAAGWVDREGQASYVYPEITGYYLQWLAWHAACHGVNKETRRRAAAAQRWLLAWAFGAETPETRIYLEPAAPDWRNSALFFFDVAMVLRGLAGAARLGLIETDPRLVERISELLWRLVAADGMFDACVATRVDATLPDRWSTRRGPFLSKAAGGVLIAAAQFSSLPRALAKAADASFAAALESMSAESQNETHALLYGIEGALSLPHHPAAVAAMPHMVRQLRDLLQRSAQLGHMPELLAGTGRVRLDIVAQAIRAAAFLLPQWSTELPTENVDQMAQVLVHYIDPDLGIPFSPNAPPHQYNVWTAMFAEQALFAAECGPGDARLADLRLCLV
ncbi:MAG TPA: hypothetical protein VN326_03235 [Casimicrobiaceae bacterium]|nr:hypothetical protein [Casimicrobiaceae bacterium]